MARVVERVRIVGVDCPSCVYGIEKRVASVRGVASFKADHVSGEAVIEYDSDLCSLSDIAKAIRDAGYDIEKDYLELYTSVEGEEAYYIESRIKRAPGVIDCRISTVSGIIRVLFNPYTTSREEIEEHLKRLGVEFTKKASERVRFGVTDTTQRLAKLTAFTLALLAILYHNIGVVAISAHTPLWSYRDLVLFSIATTVVVLNIDTISKGLKSLARLSPTMESLIALSSMSSYLFSIAIALGFLGSSETFFEASAGVLGFVGLGKYIEARLRGRASEAIERLGGFIKGRVRVIRGSSVEEVDVENTSPGDIVEFKSGERILVDGVTVEGWGYVDESTFTGETTPRFKSAEKRDPVFAGTVLVSGYIRVRVTRASRDTVLSHIVETVKESLFTKPRAQLIADKIVGYMTWVVIALSIVTFIYWATRSSIENATLFMASVLAVTCPCPLGIAIPMVYAIAAYRIASLGVVIRRGDVFERALKVDVAIFDKTGTLTVGRPAVERVVVLNGSEGDVMSKVCSAESRSEHPLASAVLKFCRDRGYTFADPSRYDHIPGLGIVAEVSGEEVVIGSENLVIEMGVAVPEDVKSLVVEYRRQGYTVVFVGLNKVLSGVILVRDSVREDAVRVVEFLKRRKVRTAIASGDSMDTVKAIARELKVDDAYSELTPDDKTQLVEELQRGGFKVMFVGDGVNDAGAIGKAFLGVAIGSGADIAKIAGDVVIMNEKLRDIETLITFSERVKRKSIENLAWAFIYNLTLVPIAMGVLHHTGIVLRPEMAAIAMIASDISVVLNSLSLLKHKLVHS
uniref:Cation-translocating P-type ATPase n=1 Tax=Ignisphaera aggregans TaxID=334771 RepID=A0A7J3Z7K7_9CREN